VFSRRGDAERRTSSGSATERLLIGAVGRLSSEKAFADLIRAAAALIRDGHDLELRIAASDENGNRSDVPFLPLDLSADKLPKPDGFVRYDTKIKIHGQAHHLVVATYDPMSGKIATAEADLAP